MKNKRPSSAGLLALVVMVAVASMTLSELGSRDARERAAKKKLLHDLSAVIPATHYDNDPLHDAQYRQYGDKLYRVYPFIKERSVVGYVIQNESHSAYNGLLRLLVGVRHDGISSGVRVVQHRETPGLGDRIEPRHSHWILNLAGLPINRKSWQLEKDGGTVANLSGATVTARATLDTAYEALLYFMNELKHSHRYQ